MHHRLALLMHHPLRLINLHLVPLRRLPLALALTIILLQQLILTLPLDVHTPIIRQFILVRDVLRLGRGALDALHLRVVIFGEAVRAAAVGGLGRGFGGLGFFFFGELFRAVLFFVRGEVGFGLLGGELGGG